MLENRMDKMERLILTMMETSPQQSLTPGEDRLPRTPLSVRDAYGQPATERPGSPRSPEPNTVGIIKEVSSGKNGVLEIGVEREDSFCAGEAHWATLLNGIAEVRTYLEDQRSRYAHQEQKVAWAVRHPTESPGPSLLLGSTKTPSRKEIMAQLPSQAVCEALVARYFYVLEPALHVLHIATFRKQFVEFRREPDQAPTIWIGLLCAIMRIAVLSWRREGAQPPDFIIDDSVMADNLRGLVTSALILADYTRPQEHLVDILILHLNGEYQAVRDANPNVYILLGMVIRIAMRMGYHREPRHVPDLTPFQGEMRRRVWAYICMADILFSFQAGLPSMIRARQCDAHIPHNIHDDAAFYETCPELPPTRPESEVTQVSLLIIKCRLTAGFARALKEMNSTNKPAYDRILEIDRELREMYDNVPDYFQLKAVSQMASDPLPVIASRFMLANIHHKSICVIHSRYLEAARSNARYMYSRRASLDSAVRLLSFQALQHDLATRACTRQPITNYQTSLTTHDYLLGATIVCAELSITKDPVNLTQRKDSGPSKSELLMALQRSAQIWRHMRDWSMEAYKASDVLGMLCSKFQPATDPQKLPNSFWAHNNHEYSSRGKHLDGPDATVGRDASESYSDRSQGWGATPLPMSSSTYNEVQSRLGPPPLTELFCGSSANYFSNGDSRTGSMLAQSDPNTLLGSDYLDVLPTPVTYPETEWGIWNTSMPSLDLSDPYSTLWNCNSGRNPASFDF